MSNVVKALSQIKCPSVREGKPCRIPNCIFDHTAVHIDKDKDESNEIMSPEVLSTDTKDIGEDPVASIEKESHITVPEKADEEETVVKKNDKTGLVVGQQDIDAKSTTSTDAVQETVIEVEEPTASIEQEKSKPASEPTQESEPKPESESEPEVITISETKVVRKEEPSNKKPEKRKFDKMDVVEDLKTLTPKVVLPYAPAQTGARVQFLKQLQQVYKKQKSKTPNKDAVESEFEIASKTSNRTYDVTMKRYIYKLTKTPIKSKSQKTNASIADDANTKMLTKLETLISNIKTLKQNKYITEIPTSSALPTKVKCERCGIDFEIDKVLYPVKCTYHPEKSYMSRQTARSYASNDINSRFYPCCSKPMGESEGCQTGEYHVYKLTSGEALQYQIPFRSSDEFTTDKPKYKALALDCEMGFTAFGFELIRLTICDFTTEAVLFDKIIRPKSKVLDLNTQWSGVSVIDPADSISFEEMFQELGKFMDKNTILIGHGLENDLNVMRLVHCRVVDTSILFPRGLRKRSLKDLTFEFLSKKIQTGEHDSKEDALSCVHILKWFINRAT